MPRNTAITWYVDAAVGSSGNGLTWGTAFKTISEAIAKLNNRNLYKSTVSVYIKTGTYAEGIKVANAHVTDLKLLPSGGAVTLTGKNDSASWSSSIELNMCVGGFTVGNSSTEYFICAPSAVHATTHIANYFVNVSGTIVCNTQVNGTGWSTSSRYGVFIDSCGMVNLSYAVLTNLGNAISLINSRIALGTVSGTGNNIGLSSNASIIHQSTGYTASGTVNKSNGGIVINSSGSLV